MPDDVPDFPSPSATNNGVYQTGGTSSVGNQAVGHGAQAFSGAVSFQFTDTTQRAQVTGLLAELERLLTEHAAALPDAGATHTELRRLREELEESRPEPRVLQRALDRLTSFVRPVTPLVVAVGQLSEAVRASLGH
jgi:hypothetical protein